MHPAFALFRLIFFAAALYMLGSSAPGWALLLYIVCFSFSFVGDFLFGITPSMSALGALLGLAKWVALATMVWSTVKG